LRNTGWTREQFDTAWVEQNGKCAICSIEMTRKGRGVAEACADHNHATGRQRQLLCTRCNFACGSLRDDPAIAESVARYLKRHSVPTVGEWLREREARSRAYT
jgi:hypothetical protein